jgi:hypothetical protein
VIELICHVDIAVAVKCDSVSPIKFAVARPFGAEGEEELGLLGMNRSSGEEAYAECDRDEGDGKTAK